MLHLFRRVMGTEAFDAAMRHTYDHYAGRPITTPVFLDILRDHTGAPLDSIIEYWVYGAQVPTLQVAWDAEERRLTWQIQGDNGTLDGVPFEVQITREGPPVYVSVSDGSYTFSEAVDGVPQIRPVGILMKVNAAIE